MQIILILLSQFSLSLPFIQGDFSYTGERSLHFGARNEVVYPLSQEGQLRLKALKEQNYSCQKKSQFYHCRIPLDKNDEMVTEQLNNFKPDKEHLTLTPILSYELITDGEIVQQYLVDQSLILEDGSEMRPVTYTINSTLVKLGAGNVQNSKEYHSLILGTDEDILVELNRRTLTESRWVFFEFWLAARYQKQKNITTH